MQSANWAAACRRAFAVSGTAAASSLVGSGCRDGNSVDLRHKRGSWPGSFVVGQRRRAAASVVTANATVQCSGGWQPLRNFWGGGGQKKGTTSVERWTDDAEIVCGPPGTGGSLDCVDLFRRVRPFVASIYIEGPSSSGGSNGRPGGVLSSAVSLALARSPKQRDLDDLRESDLRFLGSGFLYGHDGFVVTCAHLFEGFQVGAELVLRLGDGRWFLAELWGLSEASDVAVVRVFHGKFAVASKDAVTDIGARTPTTPLTLSTAQPLPRQGEWVAVCGTTQHGCETIGLAGMVSQPRQAFRDLAVVSDRHFVQMAITTLPGMSGSPVVTPRGEVVAMLAKKFEEHGLALPAAHVAAVAQYLEIHRTWAPPKIGADLVEDGPVGSPRVTIQAVRQGSLAAAAGIIAGDELLTVRGIDVVSIVDVREALALPPTAVRTGDGCQVPDIDAASGDPNRLCIRVRRSGEVMDFHVPTAATGQSAPTA
eukprot:TRINITY_DN42413_c0_g1_i1.p1 TRINITY_DN42413_c0_g1~~TRINITY_DN42413_c0_g1_i1.p1  ORF type:complete len:481 (+),score=70.38 TRINITY_DN42413_c0_g1_i1:122-1564(+)